MVATQRLSWRQQLVEVVSAIAAMVTRWVASVVQSDGGRDDDGIRLMKMGVAVSCGGGGGRDGGGGVESVYADVVVRGNVRHVYPRVGVAIQARDCSRSRYLNVVVVPNTPFSTKMYEIEKFSYMYGGGTNTPFSQKDVAFLVEKCRESLVSLRVDSCYIGDVTQDISNAVNLQDFFSSIFYEDEQYSGFKLPSSIHNLGLIYFPESSIRFVNPLLDQLRELDLRWLDDPLPQVWSCQCYFLHRCPNLEVLHTDYVCGDIGLGCISKLCKKLRKLTVYSGTHVGLMVAAQGCPNLEYLHVELTNISNEALERIGSNLKNLRVFYIRVQQQEDEEYNTILPLDNRIRAMLIGCAKLERLSLDIYPEVLTNVGLGFIGKYGVNLRFLSLASIGGSDEGLMELSEGCPKLQKLKLTSCPFTDQAVKEFWLNVKSLRYIWFKSGNDIVLTLTHPDFDMCRTLVLQKMREQIARLKAEVEWAAQEAATVPDGSGSSSRMSSQSSQDYCSNKQAADMIREYEVEIAMWKAQAQRVARLNTIERQSYALLESEQTKCSNFKVKDLKINMLETRIKILEARLKLERHPEDHTCQSRAILYELLDDMENLCLE
ncbi:zinc finger, CCHC-type containing protein [Tanacetum coccineum]|uniref:Zinc finger, CCHC-type containing protein n=1 Tax=Tanacetum coccineum TaxID=301880 RepID=A0ABQ4YET5_9ASTR